MGMNPHCAVINGRPRTPRDQGSVENANKLVQWVLKSICCENRLRSGEVNWTKLLGRVMSVCNSHSDCRASSVSAYEAVFGQKYHSQLKCTISELRKCRTISQRLSVSPNDRLETYVREHDIVDVVPSELQQVLSATSEADSDGDDEEEGLEIDEDAFPELANDDEELPIGDTFNPDDDVAGAVPTAGIPFLPPFTTTTHNETTAVYEHGDVGDDDSRSLLDEDNGEGDPAQQGSIGGLVCQLTYDSPAGPTSRNNVAGDPVSPALVESSVSEPTVAVQGGPTNNLPAGRVQQC